MGSIPGRGTKIPHAVWHDQKINNNNKYIYIYIYIERERERERERENKLGRNIRNIYNFLN